MNLTEPGLADETWWVYFQLLPEPVSASFFTEHLAVAATLLYFIHHVNSAEKSQNFEPGVDLGQGSRVEAGLHRRLENPGRLSELRSEIASS